MAPTPASRTEPPQRTRRLNARGRVEVRSNKPECAHPPTSAKRLPSTTIDTTPPRSPRVQYRRRRLPRLPCGPRDAHTVTPAAPTTVRSLHRRLEVLQLFGECRTIERWLDSERSART